VHQPFIAFAPVTADSEHALLATHCGDVVAAAGAIVDGGAQKHSGETKPTWLTPGALPVIVHSVCGDSSVQSTHSSALVLVDGTHQPAVPLAS
jgi:hypothetical protein